LVATAFAFEKENPAKLISLVPQRLIYSWLMMYVFFKAIKRTGNVKDTIGNGYRKQL